MNKIYGIYFVCNFIGFIISIVLVKKEIVMCDYGRTLIRLSRLTSICFLLFNYLELYCISKFCLLLRMEGLVQIFPLKLSHYLLLIEYICIPNACGLALTYILLDIVFLTIFMYYKDEVFSTVYHDYNMKIGCDIDKRNSFIYRNVFYISKHIALVFHVLMVLSSLTFSTYDRYYRFNFYKTGFIAADCILTYNKNVENRGLKLLSVLMYSYFSLFGLFVMSTIIKKYGFRTYTFFLINEVNILFSTIMNILDLLWYGCGLDENKKA